MPNPDTDRGANERRGRDSQIQAICVRFSAIWADVSTSAHSWNRGCATSVSIAERTPGVSPAQRELIPTGEITEQRRNRREIEARVLRAALAAIALFARIRG